MSHVSHACISLKSFIFCDYKAHFSFYNVYPLAFAQLKGFLCLNLCLEWVYKKKS